VVSKTRLRKTEYPLRRGPGYSRESDKRGGKTGREREKSNRRKMALKKKGSDGLQNSILDETGRKTPTPERVKVDKLEDTDDPACNEATAKGGRDVGSNQKASTQSTVLVQDSTFRKEKRKAH